MPANTPIHLALRSKQQKAELYAKAHNRGMKNPSQLFRTLLDALPVHPLSDPETVTLPKLRD